MFNLKKASYTCAIAALLASTTPATANEDMGMNLPGEFSGTVTLASQYIFRGITQSNENPAIQGSLDWSHDSGVYLGIWGSNVDFGDGDEASSEFDLYGGYNFTVNNIDFGLGGIWYEYPGADNALNYNYFEFTGSIGYDFGTLATTGSIYYSPDYYAGSDDSYYYNLAIDAPLSQMPGGLTLSASLGFMDIDDEVAFGVPDYTDWSIGLGATVEGFDVSVTYSDTDLDSSECADGCDDRVVLAVSRSF